MTISIQTKGVADQSFLNALVAQYSREPTNHSAEPMSSATETADWDTWLRISSCVAFTSVLTPPTENPHALVLPLPRQTQSALLNQPSLTDRIDIDPSVTLSAKNVTLSALSCAPST